MSYPTLEIRRLARETTVAVHQMTLQDLPKFKLYGERAQIRPLMKSVKSNIVEGDGRRRYKQGFIKFLTYAHASCDESVDHLETLFETGSLSNEIRCQRLHDQLTALSAKLNRFIQRVEASHQSVREDPAEYGVNA